MYVNIFIYTKHSKKNHGDRYCELKHRDLVKHSSFISPSDVLHKYIYHKGIGSYCL